MMPNKPESVSDVLAEIMSGGMEERCHYCSRISAAHAREIEDKYAKIPALAKRLRELARILPLLERNGYPESQLNGIAYEMDGGPTEGKNPLGRAELSGRAPISLEG